MGSEMIHQNAGAVPKINDEGEEINPSNNRGELIGIHQALLWMVINFPNTDFVIYSDSKYSINAITKWYPNWSEEAKIGKKNLDLLAKICELIEFAEFKHIHCSHDNEKPTDPKELFLWKGNDLADRYAKAALPK
jgi:ribonuclease HI